MLDVSKVREFREHLFGCSCELCKEVGEALGAMEAAEVRISNVRQLQLRGSMEIMFQRRGVVHRFLNPGEASRRRLLRVMAKLDEQKWLTWLYRDRYGKVCGEEIVRRESAQGLVRSVIGNE